MKKNYKYFNNSAKKGIKNRELHNNKLNKYVKKIKLKIKFN